MMFLKQILNFNKLIFSVLLFIDEVYFFSVLVLVLTIVFFKKQ